MAEISTLPQGVPEQNLPLISRGTRYSLRIGVCQFLGGGNGGGKAKDR